MPDQENGFVREKTCEAQMKAVDGRIDSEHQDNKDQWNQINKLRESVAALRTQVLMICLIGSPVGGLVTILIAKALGF